MKKILFVCIGNICRSPLLHHLLKKKLELEGVGDQIVVDSCGISAWHVGEDMDERMRLAAKQKGHNFELHKAKLFQREMLQEYDYIFVVTKELLDHLSQKASSGEKSKILMATHFSPSFKNEEIPDPYYGGQSHFDEIYQMIDTIVDETLAALKKEFVNHEKEKNSFS